MKKETKYSYSESRASRLLYIPRACDLYPSPGWQWWAVQWGYGQLWKATAHIFRALHAQHPERPQQPL